MNDMGDYLLVENIPYGSHERHKLDIFVPKNANNISGVIMFIHGGGWVGGDKSAHHPDARYFCERGYISATMNYRFVSEEINVFNELDDITLALITVREKCIEYGFNTDKLLLSGGSAGAHLALMYTYTRKNEAPLTPVAVCVYCPPTNCAKPDFLSGLSGEFDDWKFGLLSKCCGIRIDKSNFLDSEQQNALINISPGKYVSSKCVPTAVFHGKADDLVPFEHSVEFLSLLSRMGVKNDLIIYENSGHALDKDPETTLKTKEMICSYAETYF